MKPTSTFLLHVFLFFFFFQPVIVDFVNCEQCICVLFTVLQITLFSNFFIKNGSHNTIYTFKNYFATVFSVSVFSFSKNKLNPNTPIDSLYPFDHLYVSRVKFYNFLYPLSIMTKKGRKCGFFLRFYMLGGEIHSFVRGRCVSSC